MPKDLGRLSRAALASEFDRRSGRADKASAAVYALAAHGSERFSEIVERLGPDHRVVVAYHAAANARVAVEVECQLRFGPGAVTFASQWPTLLRSQRGGPRLTARD